MDKRLAGASRFLVALRSKVCVFTIRESPVRIELCRIYVWKAAIYDTCTTFGEFSRGGGTGWKDVLCSLCARDYLQFFMGARDSLERRSNIISFLRRLPTEGLVEEQSLTLGASCNLILWYSSRASCWEYCFFVTEVCPEGKWHSYHWHCIWTPLVGMVR